MKPKTKTLLRSKLQHEGDGVYELALLKGQTLKLATLTTLEESELICHHRKPNFDRARLVKTLLGRGCNQSEIVAAIGHNRPAILKDMAALLSAARKSRKTNALTIPPLKYSKL